MKNFDWLMASDPGDRLSVMYETGYLKKHLPEVHNLYGVPQRPEHHPEVDVGKHIELCLKMAANLNLSHRARFAVLVHDLGKGLSPPEQWPSHIDHEWRGMIPVEQVCDRFQVPEDWKKLALVVCERHLVCHKVLKEASARTVLNLIDRLGDFLNDFAGDCEADAKGRLGMHERQYPQADFFRQVSNALKALPRMGLDGQDRETRRAQQERHRARLLMVDDFIRFYKEKLRKEKIHV